MIVLITSKRALLCMQLRRLGIDMVHYLIGVDRVNLLVRFEENVNTEFNHRAIHVR